MKPRGQQDGLFSQNGGVPLCLENDFFFFSDFVRVCKQTRYCTPKGHSAVLRCKWRKRILQIRFWRQLVMRFSDISPVALVLEAS